MFKTIVVHLDDSQRCLQRLEVATRLAVVFESRLVGLYVTPSPELSPALVPLLPAEVLQRRRQEVDESKLHAETLFRKAAADATVAAIEWLAPAGFAIDSAIAQARCADLTVFSQPEEGSADSLFSAELAESVVLSAGRPMLLVPYIGARASLGDRVLLAWDGGREASRAIADAMPILARARRVTVMSISDPGKYGADIESVSRLATYLNSHGIAAKIDHQDNSEIPIGEYALSRVADLDVDLIVMGAYAHTRFRDLVLGGVTRTMLHSMTVPVLMSH